MLGANFLANLFAVVFVQKLLFRVEPMPEEIWQIPAIGLLDDLFTPFAFTFVFVMTLLYEKPIRAYLNSQFRHKTISEEFEALLWI